MKTLSDLFWAIVTVIVGIIMIFGVICLGTYVWMFLEPCIKDWGSEEFIYTVFICGWWAIAPLIMIFVIVLFGPSIIDIITGFLGKIFK